VMHSTIAYMASCQGRHTLLNITLLGFIFKSSTAEIIITAFHSLFCSFRIVSNYNKLSFQGCLLVFELSE
ncbi:hypothetical protein LTR66_015654, partial [Elasticomyces elasticus]